MKNIKGFTIIEWMIVVAIIGILAATALPAYKDFKCRRDHGIADRSFRYDYETKSCKYKDGNNNAVEKVTDTPPKKPANKPAKPKPKKVVYNNTDEVLEWTTKTKDCPKALARLRTYVMMEEPLDDLKRMDLQVIIDKCGGDK